MRSTKAKVVAGLTVVEKIELLKLIYSGNEKPRADNAAADLKTLEAALLQPRSDSRRKE